MSFEGNFLIKPLPMKFLITILCTTLVVEICAQEVSGRYELVKMDKTVNTFRHEAAPVVSPDGKSLYFFVQDHPEVTASGQFRIPFMLPGCL